ncbi:TRAP transporter small permease subunit [Litoreibacter ascidiaceicola]|nr:TRAP transporter small permease [Litoreibacter ascidiaceicola]
METEMKRTVDDDQIRHAAGEEQQALLKPDTFIGWINFYAGEFGKYLFAIAILISVYEVFARYLFDKPTIWAFELTVMLCATGYFIAGGYVTQQRRHIGITVIHDMVSPRIRYGLDIFGNCMGIFAMSVLIWSGWGPAERALIRGETAGTPWDPPSPQILKPMIVIGATLIVLQLLSHLFQLIKNGPETTTSKDETLLQAQRPAEGHDDV